MNATLSSGLKLATAVLAMVLGNATSTLRGSDFFTDQVAPIFSQHCLHCHSEKDPAGEVSIVDPKRLIEDGFVSPGDVDSSHLVELIHVVNGTAQMPKDAEPLSNEQVAIIKRWIQQDALIPSDFRLSPPAIADHQWWSLRPIVPASEPISSDFVDQRIEQRLKQNGLTPLGEADPATLIRRLTYDLHGLPPDPEAVDRFVDRYRSAPEETWHETIDRLLAAPEFGEKWAQHWLDLARYAETHGYDKDKPRATAWPYRDYVINSFNDDKPYGQFAREQIAGDVIGNDASEGIVATGFLAAGPWDLIAHKEVGEDKLDGRIAKHLDRDEMASAVFNVFQSTTIQCAQCHNHKFDPILSRDYYRVHAVFAAVDRAERVYAGLSKQQLADKAEIQFTRDDLVRQRDNLVAKRNAEIDQATKPIQPEIDRLTDQANQNPPPKQHGFHSTIASRQDESKWVEVSLPQPISLRRIELFSCYDDFNNIGSGFGFPVRFKVEVAASSIGDNDTTVVLDATGSDYENPQSAPLVIDCQDHLTGVIRLTATKLAPRKNDFILALGEMRAIASKDDQNVATGGTVAASDPLPSNSRWAPEFLIDGKFFQPALTVDQQHRLKDLNRQRQRMVDDVTTDAYRKRKDQLDQQIASLDKQLARFPEGKMVYAITTDFEPSGKFKPTRGKNRDIRLLLRGDLRLADQRVLPGAPDLWPTAPTRFADHFDYDEADARVGLAEYVTHRENPLFWRSIANRIWQWTFGRPIVATPNDFGRMGATPTHPELLDALAAGLRDDPDQSIKSLVRLLVTTRAYRRASFAVGDDSVIRRNAEIDGENQLLWRHDRRRLTAEEFRDTVLAVSGVLRRQERGGPSFSDFVIQRPEHSPHYEYGMHDPNDPASHRRTIYRFVVRSQPHPMLTTLDCADPSISVSRRDESTTALQALTQWNNQMIEVMSKRFAERLVDATASTNQSIRYACRLTWCRPPNETESESLVALAEQHGLESACRVILNASPMMYLD